MDIVLNSADEKTQDEILTLTGMYFQYEDEIKMEEKKIRTLKHEQFETRKKLGAYMRRNGIKNYDFLEYRIKPIDSVDIKKMERMA